MRKIFMQWYKEKLAIFYDLKMIYLVNKNLTEEQKKIIRSQMIRARYKNFFLSILFVLVSILMYLAGIYIGAKAPWESFSLAIWKILFGLLFILGLASMVSYARLIIIHRK